MGHELVDEDDAVPHFDNAGDELRFWRDRAQRLRSTLRNTESTLKDFEESSRELEKEMEGELNAANVKSRDLQVRAEKLKGDVDELKAKYQRALTDHNKELAALNRELSLLRESHNIYKSNLRDMELDNDELENAERMVASSLSDMESRYNRAIERTALLEEEVVAKTKLEEENQRLKDELQEVKEELAVWQDRYECASPAAANGRSSTRSSVQVDGTDGVSSGRGSLDIERRRPLSRTSVDRPHSRTAGYQSPSAVSGSLAQSGATRRSTMTTSHRSSMAASQYGHRHRDSPLSNVETTGMSSAPGSVQFRPRHTVGAGSSRPSSTTGFTGSTATSASSSAARLQPRTTLSSRSRVQNGSTMRKMAGLLQNLRELQATVHSATRAAPDGQASAIPRPASRLSSSIGPGADAGTPRRSTEGRRDEIGTPSAIPVPANGLSRSTSQRPSSRLSLQHTASISNANLSRVPSSIRSQTPNLEQFSSLDFLDKDPAIAQNQYRRRSQLALSNAPTSANTPAIPSLASVRSSLDRGGDPDELRSRSHTNHAYSAVRPRGSTFSSTTSPYPTSSITTTTSQRRPLQSRTKQAAPPPPPPSSMRMPASNSAASRQRSSSIGPSHAN